MSMSFLTSATSIPISNFLGRRPKSQPYLPQAQKPSPYISSQQKQQGEDDVKLGGVIDRRNVLLGLGGSATAAFTNMAIASPVAPPDLKTCHSAFDDMLAMPKDSVLGNVECCPPYSKDAMLYITDFKLPSRREPLRTRQPAHELDEENIAKFRLAMSRMKELKPDDPRNFMQQAHVHCAFCNGAFDELSTPPKTLSVHGSWLFLPWHRYYIYFWERILGNLIDDPTFAIPFWNWDDPAGMKIPEMYLGAVNNPLYNCNRNSDHLTKTMNFGVGNIPDEDIIHNNQFIMYTSIRDTLDLPESFMGKTLSAGQNLDTKPSGPGVLENIHATPHRWVGSGETPNWDMGNFHTAARDPLFWAHHANVDRMWSIYREVRGKREFKDKDWLDASFVFCDENARLVRCKVRDCLDPTKLRYQYEAKDRPWTSKSKRSKKGKAKKRSAGAEEVSEVSEFGPDARTLDGTIRALVTRPKASRSKDEKEDAVEVLYIKNITFDTTIQTRFDVYLAKTIEGTLVGKDLGQLAGFFDYIPHNHAVNNQFYQLDVGITHLVEDIEADGDEKLVVSLVPEQGNVTIGAVDIQLVEVEVEDVDEDEDDE